jgi:ribosomal protein L24E
MHTKQSYAEQMMICTSIKKKIADQKRMCTSPGNFFGNLQIRVLEDGRHPMTSTKKKQKKNNALRRKPRAKEWRVRTQKPRYPVK